MGMTADINNLVLEDLTKEIKRTMRRSAKDAVQLGYMLRRVLEEKLYLADYDDFDTYLAKELQMDYTMANRFIGINRKYSFMGRSMEIAGKYEQYSQGLLIEMLNMTPEQEEKVTPDTTVKQAREIKRQTREPKTSTEPLVPEKKEVIIDGEFREIKEPEKVATSQPALIKPDERQREYLNAFAKKFISCEHDWMLQDYTNRVLHVNKSPEEIKQHLGSNSRTWYFTITDDATAVAHINLFDDYVQLYNDNGVYEGNFDWFYLAAAIQSMWTVVAMEQAKNEVATSQQEVESDLFRLKRLLDKKKRELDECMKVAKVEPLPEDYLYERKTVVGALANMLCELEEQQEPETEQGTEQEQPELPNLKNNDQRKEWLSKYKDWGLWYRDENIDVNYYKYDFSDGSRLVVAEYPNRRMYWNAKKLSDEHYYHLLEKNYKGHNGTYDKQYNHATDSETYLVDFLKSLQKGAK